MCFLLLALMITFIISCFSFFLYDSKLVIVHPELFFLTLNFENIIGPLIFFYFKRLLDEQFTLNWKQKLLFLPILFDIAVFIVRKGVFGSDTSFLINQITIYTIVASIAIYITASIALIYKYYKENKEPLNDEKYSWAKKVMITFCITFLLFLIFRKTYFLEHQKYTLEDNYPFYIIFSIWIYWVGIGAYLKTIIQRKKKQVYNQLTKREATLCAEDFEKLVEEEKLYLNSEITLKTVALKLKVTPQLLSYVLNTQYNKNFNTLINEYRITEVKEKIVNPKYSHLSILGIAFECGFNSKSTFNVVFKKNVQMTPQQFKSKNKVSEK